MRRRSKAPTAAQGRLAAASDSTGAPFDVLVADVLFVEDGKLKARFPDQGSKTPFDLSFLSAVMAESAAQAFAEAFVIWAASMGTYKSKYHAYKSLKYGFGRFVGEQKRNDLLALSDLNTVLVQQFSDWLHQRSPDNRKARSNLERPLRGIMERLRLLPQWSVQLAPEIEFPSQRRNRQTRPRTKNKVIDAASYDQLWLRISRKSSLLLALHDRRRAALAIWDERRPTLEEASADPAALAAYMANQWPDRIPPAFEEVRRTEIGRASDPVAWQRARRILMPEIDELVPAILILTTVFALNPGVVQEIRYRTDYEIKNSIGRDRLFLFPKKMRSRGKRQRHSVVVTQDADNPGRVITFLEERTSFLRSRSAPPQAGYLFLWFHRFGIGSFSGSDFTFREALKRFAEQHRIPGLQLKKIRPSSLDRVHQITGGNLLKVRDYAQHESIQTTFVGYDTDAMARRDTDRLADAMLQNERFVASEARVRPFLTAPGFDRGSATPGYACLDPFASPIQGETDGVLCKAYGLCPICPLAAIYPTAQGYAYLDALATKIDEALTKELVTGPEWLGRWAIVKKSVARQMRLFPPEVVVAAAAETISPLPALE